MVIAEELRLNNWISVDGVNYQVSELDGLGFGCKGKADNPWVNSDEAEPIPLSEEILLKCGFVKEEINGLVAYDLDFYRVYLDERPSFHLQAASNHYPFLAKCVYVHQLQNLYHSLTGQELNLHL